jgi:protein phosphatase
VAVLLPSHLEVGAASHTGRVRSANEDDYLVLAPQGAAGECLFAVADGMGGTVGGAEASRAAVRGLGAAFLGGGSSEERLRRGFAAACATVFDLARANPALRGMGTTLTALHLAGARGAVGHVGDTRCLRLRDGRLEQLTTDHALRGESSHLTRCIGGGREHETADLLAFDVRPGDVYLLASDGLWSVVGAEVLAARLRQLAPQAAADALIQDANAGGGPDNATAIVVRVRDARVAARASADLPRAEARMLPPVLRAGSLRRPWWPWLLLAVAVALGGATLAKVWVGFDVLEWLRGVLPRR